MFSKEQQKAIIEKLEQLKKVKEGRMNSDELAKIITKRRINWIENNLERMLIKYKGLSPEETAYRIIFFDHMKINPKDSEMIRISPTKILIKSYNFCPYLEACNQLHLDTKFICKEIGEPSINEIAKRIHPDLVFSRDYSKIRPDNDSCEEYLELIKI